MSNKFLIKSLVEVQSPLLSNDYAIVERLSTTYKMPMSGIYRDVLANRLSFEVSRPEAKGPNILSIMFVDDAQQKELLKEISLQDGILSTAKFDNTSNILSLYFNSTNPENNVITVDLNSLEDRYYAGYGLSLDNDGYFSTLPSVVMSTYINPLEGGAAIRENSLSIIHATPEQWRQMSADALSNQLYVISGENIDAFDKRIINLQDPISAQDAVTKQWIDNQHFTTEAANLSDLSSFIISSDVVTSNDLCLYNQPAVDEQGWIVSMPANVTSCTKPQFNISTNKWEITADKITADNILLSCNGSINSTYLAFNASDGIIYARKASNKNVFGIVTDEYLDDLASKVLEKLQNKQEMLTDQQMYALYAMTDSLNNTIVRYNNNTFKSFNITGNLNDNALSTNITNIYVGTQITCINDSALASQTQLKTVTIPNSVIKINSAAFSGDSQLTNLILGDNVLSIDYSAFLNTKLTHVSFGKNIKYIGGAAFYINTLTSITIPDTVEQLFTYISDPGYNQGAFDGSSINTVTIVYNGGDFDAAKTKLINEGKVSPAATFIPYGYS